MLQAWHLNLLEFFLLSAIQFSFGYTQYPASTNISTVNSICIGNCLSEEVFYKKNQTEQNSDNQSSAEPFFNLTQSSLESLTPIIIPILCLLIGSIGLVGNILSFVVLYAYHTSQINSWGECTARVNLLGLAVADFFVCLTSLPLGFVQRRHETYSFMLFYTIVGPALTTYFLSVSVWMVLLLSVVRYLAVCRPLKSRAWLTSRRIFRVILVIYLAAIVFHIPSFLMHTYEEVNAAELSANDECVYLFDGSSNNCRTFEIDQSIKLTIIVIERPFIANQVIEICYCIVQIMLTNVGPFLIVVITNVSVIRACRQSDACRKTFIDTNDQQRYYKHFKRSKSSHEHIFSSGLKAIRNYNIKQNLPTSKLTPRSTIIFSQRISPVPSLLLQQTPNRATNRVTPLLLAVIVAFLCFTAPFGIVHFTCLRIMDQMGEKLRDDLSLRNLYSTLNLTVEWTNVIQLVGCAFNFFLYFFVSITFRRTTKRMLGKICKQLHTCCFHINAKLLWRKDSHSTESWQNDSRMNELRRELDLKLGTQKEFRRWGKPSNSVNFLKERIARWLGRTSKESISLPKSYLIGQIASAPAEAGLTGSTSELDTRKNTAHSEFLLCTCIRNNPCLHCLFLSRCVHCSIYCHTLNFHCYHHHNALNIRNRNDTFVQLFEQFGSYPHREQSSTYCARCRHLQNPTSDKETLSQAVQVHSELNSNHTDQKQVCKISGLQHPILPSKSSTINEVSAETKLDGLTILSDTCNSEEFDNKTSSGSDKWQNH